MLKLKEKLNLKENKSIVSVIWYIGGTFLVQGINFITTLVYPNLMTVEVFGKLSLYTMWLSFFHTFMYAQVNATINNAHVRYKKDDMPRYLSTLMWIQLLCFAVFFIPILIFQKPLASIMDFPTLIVLALPVTSFFYGIVQTTQSDFIAQKRHKSFFVVSLLYTGLSVGLSIIFILLNQDQASKYTGKAYGLLISATLLGGSWLLYFLIKGRFSFHPPFFRFCLTMSAPLIFHAMSQLILGQSDRYMISMFMGDFHVGIYSFAYTLGTIINILWLACNYAWVPWYYDRRKNEEFDKIKSAAGKYAALFMAAFVCFIFILPEAIYLVTRKSEYITGVPVIVIVAAGFYFMFLYSFPVNYEFYLRKTGWIAVGTIFASLSNIGLNFVLIPKMGILGAALATLISYFLLFLLHLFIASRILKEYDLKLRFFIQYSLPVIGALLLYFLIQKFMVLRWGLCFTALILLFVYFKYQKSKIIKNHN